MLLLYIVHERQNIISFKDTRSVATRTLFDYNCKWLREVTTRLRWPQFCRTWEREWNVTYVVIHSENLMLIWRVGIYPSFFQDDYMSPTNGLQTLTFLTCCFSNFIIDNIFSSLSTSTVLFDNQGLLLFRKKKHVKQHKNNKHYSLLFIDFFSVCVVLLIIARSIANPVLSLKKYLFV